METCLFLSDLPGQPDRKDIYSLFKPFGVIKKLFIHPTDKTGNIILESKEAAEKACAALNGAPPLYLKVSLSTKDKRNSTNNNSFRSQDNVSPLKNGAMNYFKGDDDDSDLMAEIGPILININGIQVNTLIADDGEIYVPLTEVRELGFELFDPLCIPKRLDYEAQQIKEFELYLAMKTRKFMTKRRYQLPESVIDGTVQKMKQQAFNIKVTASNDSRNNYFVQNERRSFSQYNGKQLDNKKHDAQSTEHKPLRKPHTDKDVDQKWSGRDRENAPSNNYERRGKSMGRNSFNNVENRGQQGSRNQNKFESKNVALPKTENASVRTTDVNESRAKPKDIEPNTAFKRTESTYNQVDLDLNTEVEVEITEVDSKNKVWVYRIDKKSIVENILIETNVKANEVPAGKPVTGKICAAMFLDAWYRVIILNVQPILKVLYIDFGNKNIEQIKEIRDLPSSLTSIPAQAVCITFNNTPSKTLEAGMELKIVPNQKLSDNTYVVTEVIERKVSPVLKDLNAKPAGIQFTTGTADLPKDEKQVAATSNDDGHSTGAIKKTLVFKNSKNREDSPTENMRVTPDKGYIGRSVIESIGSDGEIQCKKIFDNSTFLAFIVPNSNIDDIVVLEDIGTSAEPDKNFTAKKGELIAVHYKNENSWVRGVVIDVQNDTYTTALIDYAVVITSTEICALQKKFFDIPEFSCVCTCKPEVMDLVKKFEDIVVPCTIIETGKLKLQFNNGATCIVQCEKWNPNAKASPTINKHPQESKKTNPIFTDIPQIKTLKQDDIVIIGNVDDQKLFVKTKECNALFRNLVEEISQLKSEPLIVPPVVNQIALSTCESDPQLYRCVVKSINSNNMVELDFIDCGFQDIVPVANLREITESLARKDSSLIPIMLKSFENVEFSEAALKQLEQYRNSKTKFTANSTSKPGVFDLMDAKKTSLSDLLLSIGQARSSTPNTRASSRSSIVTYQTMAESNLSLGIHELMYFSTEPVNKASMVFMVNDEAITGNFLTLSEEIKEHVASDNTPYSPKADEICLALYEDEWYRARVITANETVDLFNVLFIDFGNSDTVSSRDIRRIPLKFTTTPPVVVNCIFQELSTKEIKGELLSRLKELLGLNKLHTVNIIRKEGKTHIITIPSIVTALQAEALL